MMHSGTLGFFWFGYAAVVVVVVVFWGGGFLPGTPYPATPPDSQWPRGVGIAEMVQNV